MINKTLAFQSILISLIIFSGSISNLSAQEGTKTPDGTNLKRSSYYGVQSTIPSYKRVNPDFKDLELPCSAEGDEIIRHTGYTLSYNIEHKQARWVAYKLTAEETRPAVKRNNRFIPDPEVLTGSASNNDYKNSGYDKGHLAPSADMCYSIVTMQESFYLSNMSPQKPGFNRGIWKELEAQVRQWAIDDSIIFIVTGGVLAAGMPAIGSNKVSVPKLFYKVIIDFHGDVPKGIGFVIPNDKSNKRLQSYTVTIDSVEVLTGINFFCRLPDDMEKKIESVTDTTLWRWQPVSNGGGKQEED
ncbi:MAG: DNA/RNA non-specific endonuclease [Bacteroidota bacterium]